MTPDIVKRIWTEYDKMKRKHEEKNKNKTKVEPQDTIKRKEAKKIGRKSL